jgi:RNA polymerase sigma-70 factor, ECF subfamily
MARKAGDPGGALARARAGDEAGFLELWRALQPRLLRYIHVLGCDDPDDVASETWLQVVRDLHKFAGDDEDFRRWLFTVGRNRAIDAARARTRRRVSPLAHGLDGFADGQMVEDQVLDGMSVRTALAMLSGLSQDQAEAVALRVIAGLDTPAVASILGKSPGAVRVALHRGLRALAADPRVRALALAAGAGAAGGGVGTGADAAADAAAGTTTVPGADLGSPAPGSSLFALGEVE